MPCKNYREAVEIMRACVVRIVEHLDGEIRNNIQVELEWLCSLGDSEPERKDFWDKYQSTVKLLTNAFELIDKKQQVALGKELSEAAQKLDALYLEENGTDVYEKYLGRNPSSSSASLSPVIVLSSWRSGSTLLCSLLNTHPELGVVPENNFLDFFLQRSVSGENTDNLPVVYRPLSGIVRLQVQTELMGLDGDEFYSLFSDYVNKLFHRLAGSDASKRLVWKETVNLDFLDVIDMLFSYEAQFVWLIRHGMDVCDSYFRRYDKMSPVSAGNLSLYADEWIVSNQKIESFMHRIGNRGTKIKYEDLVEDTSSTMKKLQGFMNINHHEIIRGDPKGLGGDHLIHNQSEIDRNRKNGWKRWPAPIIKEISSIVNPGLEDWGYSPVSGGVDF